MSSNDQRQATTFRFPWASKTGREVKGPGTPTGKSDQIAALFTPFSSRSLLLKHRLVVSPMCQYSSEDGFFNDWHLVHLGSFARGGAALVFTEATAVTPEGRITPYDAGLWKPEHMDQLRRIVGFVHSQGAAAGIQLAHAGRKASTIAPFFHRDRRYHTPEDGGWVPVAPSPLPFSEQMLVPHELSRDEIRALVDAFATAARRSHEVGFDVIEIHGAHGYLLHSFYSPVSNHRTDEYGGSFENRIRFFLEVAAAVRGAFPAEKPVFARISASDWVEGGWSLQDSVELSKRLKAIGIDLIDCSSGGISLAQKITLGPGYQVPFAEAVKKQAEIPTAAVGLITEPRQANEIVQSGRADLVVIARQMLKDPNFALTAAKALNVDVEWPLQYERAKDT